MHTFHGNVQEAPCCYPSSQWATLDAIAWHLSWAGARVSAQPPGCYSGLSWGTDTSTLLLGWADDCDSFPVNVTKHSGQQSLCLVRKITDVKVEETYQQTSWLLSKFKELLLGEKYPHQNHKTLQIFMDGKRKEQKKIPFLVRLNEAGKLKGQEFCSVSSLIWRAMLLPPYSW